MEQNVGSTDRHVRIGLGVITLLIGLVGFVGVIPIGELVVGVLAVVGLVLVGTGALQHCLLYRMLGVKTA